jgi:transcriptional regulator with XRE-family HTH domain
LRVHSYHCSTMKEDTERPELHQIIGVRIRALRKAKGWTQEDLGGWAELDFTTIGGAERGEKRLSVRSLARIADALGVELSWLVRTTEVQGANDPLVEELLTLVRDLPEADLHHLLDLARLEKDYLARLRRA